MQLVNPGLNVDFVGRRKYAAVVSGFLVVLSLVLFVVKQPNWGIDFTGGTEIHLKFDTPTTIGQLRAAMGSLGLSSDAVQQMGSTEEREFTVRIQDTEFGTAGMREEVEGALTSTFGSDWIEESVFRAEIGARFTIRYGGEMVPIPEIERSLRDVKGAAVQNALDENTFYVKLPGLSLKIEDAIRDSLSGQSFQVMQVDSVGPKVGDELKQQGLLSIFATLALVLIYVGFRFDLAFAPGAILALMHDVIIVVGIFTVTGHEFNLPMIGALLTIIGYSLNDTIVIYDRIRENMQRYRRLDMPKLINDSINETMGRTLATSLTTLMAMTAFLLLGGPVIETFALAIFLGVIFGTYSTVFIASPTILLMQDVRPHLSNLFAPLASDTKEEHAPQPATAAEQRRLERKKKRDAAGDA